MTQGRVEGIFIAAAPKAQPEPVAAAEAVAGVGLAGDRYANGTGTYWKMDKPGQEITMIEAEVLERLAREHGIELPAAESRRNIVTRGIALDELLHHRFAIGGVECVAIRECPPCAHLENLTALAGVKAALEGMGGLRSDIVVSGTISVGDTIRLLD